MEYKERKTPMYFGVKGQGSSDMPPVDPLWLYQFLVFFYM